MGITIPSNRNIVKKVQHSELQNTMAEVWTFWNIKAKCLLKYINRNRTKTLNGLIQNGSHHNSTYLSMQTNVLHNATKITATLLLPLY